MKIEQDGFRIAEISERVAGVDGEHGDARIVFVLPDRDGECVAPWLRADDVKALIEALTVAHGLMTGEAVHPARKLVGLKDRTGDIWLPTPDMGWSTNPMSVVGRSRAYVESEWGPVAEVWQ
jgi:hypothetical protein